MFMNIGHVAYIEGHSGPLGVILGIPLLGVVGSGWLQCVTIVSNTHRLNKLIALVNSCQVQS